MEYYRLRKEDVKKLASILYDSTIINVDKEDFAIKDGKTYRIMYIDGKRTGVSQKLLDWLVDKELILKV